MTYSRQTVLPHALPSAGIPALLTSCLCSVAGLSGGGIALALGVRRLLNRVKQFVEWHADVHYQEIYILIAMKRVISRNLSEMVL